MRLPSLNSLSERRVSLLVILFGLLVYIPFAGSYGLHDPWETHYSEVARQMAVRGDYISLYWPGAPLDPEHFWSKPVLSFWIMSLSLLAFGLGHSPSGTLALSTRAEWAVRTPFVLFGVLGIYAVYLCVSRFVSRWRTSGDSLSRASRSTVDPDFTFGRTFDLNFVQKSSTSQGTSKVSSKTVNGSVMPTLVAFTGA